MTPEIKEPNWGSGAITSPSLADATAERILDAICDGKLRPEDPFPSQYQLGEWFCVSRTVIREATKILVSKGILDVKHGKRITIRPPSHEQISESLSLAFRRKGITPLDVLELRKVVEAEAAALAALRATPENISEMRRTIEHMDKHVDSEEGYVAADIAFHTALFAAARQPVFELVLSSLSELLVESRKRSYRGRGPTERALQAHRNIFQAIVMKDAASAKTAMQRHLEETGEDLKTSVSDDETAWKS